MDEKDICKCINEKEEEWIQKPLRECNKEKIIKIIKKKKNVRERIEDYWEEVDKIYDKREWKP